MILRAVTVAAAIWAFPALSEPLPCGDEGFSVEAATPDLHATLCRTASQSMSFLAECRLPRARPIVIQTVDEIAHPLATCLAAFDCGYDRVRLVLRDDYAGLVDADDPYARFPADVLVGTLLTHELAHAMIEQNSPGRQVPLVDHEYIAAAMELEQMPPEWRAEILDHAGLESGAEGRINIWIYRLEPRRFAANAWLHFSQPENGCDLIGRLVAGDATFEEAR